MTTDQSHDTSTCMLLIVTLKDDVANSCCHQAPLLPLKLDITGDARYGGIDVDG